MGEAAPLNKPKQRRNKVTKVDGQGQWDIPQAHECREEEACHLSGLKDGETVCGQRSHRMRPSG